jgi:hypothetical protein
MPRHPEVGAAKARKAERVKAGPTAAGCRAHAIARGGGRCELLDCGVSLEVAGGELHHTKSGPNKTKHQTFGNTLMVCLPHHKAAHAGDLATLRALHEWALNSGDESAVRAMEKRIAKVCEARGMAA